MNFVNTTQKFLIFSESKDHLKGQQLFFLIEMLYCDPSDVNPILFYNENVASSGLIQFYMYKFR